MDLNKISTQIRKILDKRRKELQLTFHEDEHIYYMKDLDGEIKSNFPSVSKVYKKFYKQFDAEGKSLQMCNGDEIAAANLRENWKKAGDLSTNMGSRVHFELESELISNYKNYKKIRQPIFEINEEQKIKSDSMILGGKSFLNLMSERGAVLLDTEIVLGDPEEGYVGQPDKVWLMMNKEKTDFGFVISDWKTNQPKNFEVQYYTGRMYSPFNEYFDTALSHYYLQLPLYGRLLLKMLKGTKFESNKLLGCVVVLLKDDGSYQEYRVPQDVNNKVLNLDLKKYIKR
jgi:hypothetical protein